MPTPNTFDKFWAVRAAQGGAGAFNQKEYTVAASQTINAGDIVKWSSDQIVQAIALPGSDSSSTDSGGNLGIVGVALASIVVGSGGSEAVTGRTTIPVAIFDGNLEYAMRIYNATASSAEPRDISKGTKYQFTRWRGAGAGIWWYALTTTTTNGEMMYIDRYAGSAADDDYGIVWVRPALSDTVRTA